MGQRWLSIVEYARTYSVSDMTVRRRIKNGKLQAQLKEGKYYIPVDYEKPAESAIFSNVPATEVQSEPIRGAMSTKSVVRPAPTVVAGNIPSSITQTLTQHETVSVGTDALLEFCNAAVSRIATIESHVNSSYKHRVNSLEASLKLKDNEISQLRQKVEDLEMLVKMLDRRNA